MHRQALGQHKRSAGINLTLFSNSLFLWEGTGEGAGQASLSNSGERAGHQPAAWSARRYRSFFSEEVIVGRMPVRGGRMPVRGGRQDLSLEACPQVARWSLWLPFTSLFSFLFLLFSSSFLLFASFIYNLPIAFFTSYSLTLLSFIPSFLLSFP